MGGGRRRLVPRPARRGALPAGPHAPPYAELRTSRLSCTDYDRSPDRTDTDDDRRHGPSAARPGADDRGPRRPGAGLARRAVRAQAPVRVAARRHAPAARQRGEGRHRPRAHLHRAGLPAQPLARRRREAVRRRRPDRHARRDGYRVPGIAVAARDEQPRPARHRHGRRHGGHLPLRGGCPRPHHPRRQGPPRPGPLLPHQPDRRAGLHGRRGGTPSTASRRARSSARSRWWAPPARSSAGTR